MVEKLQVRVVSDPPKGFRWMIVDHVWDGVSAPIALGSHPFESYAAALLDGTVALQKIAGAPARDHPLQD